MPYQDWFLRPKIRPKADLRLICFPYAGGNAATYIPWQDLLPNNVELIAIQLPGRANRMFEPPITNMKCLVNELLTVISSLDDKPYLFFWP